MILCALGRPLKITLPETNMTSPPENGWLEYDPFLFLEAYFQGRTLSFTECNVDKMSMSNSRSFVGELWLVGFIPKGSMGRLYIYLPCGLNLWYMFRYIIQGSYVI